MVIYHYHKFLANQARMLNEKSIINFLGVLFISGCQTTYLTKDGEELVGNSVIGYLELANCSLRIVKLVQL